MRYLFLLFLIFSFSACAQFNKPKEVKYLENKALENATTKEEICPPETDSLLAEQKEQPQENLEEEVVANPEDKDANLLPQEEDVLAKEDTLNFELDLYETKELKLYFKYYTHSKRKIFVRWLERAQAYLPFIRKVFKEQGLPEDLIFLPFAESGFNPWAYSRAGAAGLWQFMPYTAKKYGLRVDWWIDERRDPYKSTYAAAEMLKELYAEFGDWYLALAAYNAGPGKIRQALKKSKEDNFFDICKSRKNRRYLRLETRHYVPKFLAILKIVRHLEELGFEPLNWEETPTQAKLSIPPSTDLLAFAQALGWNWNRFREHNPFVRRMVSPPDGEITVYLPQEKVELARQFLEKEKKSYAGFIRYKVRSGDSLWTISRRYGVPIAVLKKINDLKNNLLHPNTLLIIPRGDRESEENVLASVRTSAQKRANYEVKAGDTLWSISRQFKVSVKTLKIANGLTSSRLSIGQKLYIPDLGGQQTRLAREEVKKFHQGQLVRYQVRRGDNLWTIAKRFGVSWKQIALWNNLSSDSILRPGDTLKIYVP
ncbi:MAG: rane-bound lytic murein transglycosylase [Desulfonauticus sp.]|jgi:membrane-bound lytic murein transglycosylase D|nr:rane-bound lytic murein transglycosylase [Desulfonauticus sp.]